ncbi:MAG TPA: PAS domain S-box protein [Hyphomicrobium sp.]|jgi:PAS domain S-box-containing protein
MTDNTRSMATSETKTENGPGEVPGAQWAEELRRSESQIAAIMAIAADAIIALDGDLRITQFNDGAAAIFGYTKEEALGRGLDTLIPQRFHAAHAGHVQAFAASGVAARRMGERAEIFARRKDGSEFPAEASIAQLRVGDERIYMVLLRDVAERKRTEAILAQHRAELEVRVAERTKDLEEEIRRREEAQAALIQAQRMEAFGQLTGGIAHDFNNLLTIVLGNLEFLEPKLSSEEERALLHRAADAAQMGARLTSRLLSFARRRRLAPAVLNLNDLMLGIAELLKRSLGEQITLTTVFAGALWPTRADPSEVENAVLNLAINARDAMPQGGKLVIETRNVTVDEAAAKAEPGLRAGDYVRIAVTDSGIGMDAETLRRAFEPFFSTKEGRGTGLGLSTIYGFAQQSCGHVAIRSAPGAGTTVSLYLPRETEAWAARESETAPSVPMSENCETVLVVEDDPKLRELTLQRVEGLGYVVREAADAATAIAIMEREPDVALVFSDIVLGRGMSGLELGRWVRAHKPAVTVLLTTGYASDAGFAEPHRDEFAILHKPYDRPALAVALRAALEADQGRRTSPANT